MSRGGDELELRSGGYTAVVTQVGGGVRTLRHGESTARDLLLSYSADEVRPYYRGAVLAPWPNRVADGRYRFKGRAHQLPLTEPQRHNALHGLVAWTRFEVLTHDPTRAALQHRLVPSDGYPFDLEITVTHELGAAGLTSTVTGCNLGDEEAPWGAAMHPYLRADGGRVDDWTLQLPARAVLDVTPDRLLPLGCRPVGELDLDFRSPARIGEREVDHAFYGVHPGADGLARARVLSADGTGVECCWDPQVLPWVQVHTADLHDPAQSRRGLALEPMTCPPDAFNSGTDLVVLAPGAEHASSTTISAVLD